MCLVSFSKSESYSAKNKLSKFNSKSPKWAYISIIDSCSHKCSWCYGNYNNHDYDIMSVKDFNIITDKLLDIGIKQITFSGGEPTEHPGFLELVSVADQKGFIIHIASHGEHLNKDLVDGLVKFKNVQQVQMNYQGSKRHDQIQGSGYFEQTHAFRLLASAGIETVASITVGKYNIGDIDAIMKEADDLGTTRMRVIDATGRGVKWRKMDLIELFDTCKTAANKLGYNYTLSYDPVYEGDITIPCVQLSNLFMDINTRGKLQYCGAVLPIIEIIDFLNDSPEDILKAYKDINAEYSKGGIYCKAREVTVDE